MTKQRVIHPNSGIILSRENEGTGPKIVMLSKRIRCNSICRKFQKVWTVVTESGLAESEQGCQRDVRKVFRAHLHFPIVGMAGVNTQPTLSNCLALWWLVGYFGFCFGFFVCLFVCLLFRAAFVAYGSSQLGVKSELQLPATATATPDPSFIYHLHHSSQQHQILNPLSEARNQTHDLMDTSWVCYHWATVGTL